MLSESYKGDRRWRIEHAQIVDPADLPRFGEHGTIASMQPLHQTSDMFMAEARLGDDRLGGAYAWKSIIEIGGQDAKFTTLKDGRVTSATMNTVCAAGTGSFASASVVAPRSMPETRSSRTAVGMPGPAISSGTFTPPS